ncbi:gliding motility-associated C-terminal domain-containing protein [Flavobacterium sp.]|uniref:T9SS type B sorting domain-containing protein n=1 Tax=Flavobacterium sp. TaxID=239 RepID=UPI003C3AA363
MKDRITINLKNILLTSLIFLSFVSLSAQSIIPKALPFSQICAGSSYNKFEVPFKIDGFAAGTTFVVELSDNTGSFLNPVTTTVLPNDPSIVDTATDKTITFAIPTTIIGSETYSLRVKSSTGVASGNFYSSGKQQFPVYYKIQDSEFTINNFVPTITYCPGGSCLLTIDNPGTGTNDSPLKYPSLTYRWYKDASLVPIANTPTLTVNQPGKYYVVTNYGSCSSYSYSNRVTASESSSGSVVSITSSNGNPFCSSEDSTTLTTVIGNSYQWYKDNTAISGANSQTYVTNQAGEYAVSVSFGSCVSTGAINLLDNQIDATINIPDVNTILADEILVVTTTTNAVNPEYKWYLNGAIIPDAIESNYNVSTKGSYKVVITQTSGCNATKEFLFRVNSSIDSNVTEIPNLITPNGDGINDTWVLPKEYISGTKTEIILISSLGDIVFQTNDYQNNWPENQLDFKNVIPVYYYIITTQDNKVKKGSITVHK